MMYKIILCTILSIFAVSSSANIYFSDRFLSNNSSDTFRLWIVSESTKNKDPLNGGWQLSHGDWAVDKENDRGLSTMMFDQEYIITSKITESFSSTNQSIIYQYSLRNTQDDLDCVNTQMRLYPANIEPTQVTKDSRFNLSFGPNVCDDKKEFIISLYHQGGYYIIKPKISIPTDKLTHLYTLHMDYKNYIVNLSIDGEKVYETTFQSFRPQDEVNNTKHNQDAFMGDTPNTPFIIDETDIKPVDWSVDTPKYISNVHADKPEDWDDELDGEWTRPSILNPNYVEWAPRLIRNVNYKQNQPNDIIEDDSNESEPNQELLEKLKQNTFGQYADNTYIGIYSRQLSSGTIIDNFIITDNVKTAKKRLKEQIILHQNEQEALLQYNQETYERIERLRNMDYNDEDFYLSPQEAIKRDQEKIQDMNIKIDNDVHDDTNVTTTANAIHLENGGDEYHDEL